MSWLFPTQQFPELNLTGYTPPPNIQAALTRPGSLGRGQGQVPSGAVGGGVSQGTAQSIYEGVGGELGAGGLESLNWSRDQALDALLGVQGGDFMQQLQSGVSDWMANPQAWSDQAQRMMETGIREQGTQQLAGQQYGIGRSMAQRGQGDSGTRMKLEQRAGSASEAATLAQIREAKVAREQANLQAKGMAYNAGTNLGGLGANVAGMIADTYMGSVYDPSAANEMAIAGELLPQMAGMSQWATGQQAQAGGVNTLIQALGMLVPGQGLAGSLFG